MSANKISLNVEKTELVILKSIRKVPPDEIKSKLSGKTLHPSNSEKYLGLRVDRFLHWYGQVNSIAVKLSPMLMHYCLKSEIMSIWKNIKKYLLCNNWLSPKPLMY